MDSFLINMVFSGFSLGRKKNKELDADLRIQVGCAVTSSAPEITTAVFGKIEPSEDVHR